VLSLQQIWVSKSQIRKAQKILALQIANPQIATHAKGTKM
jgi:hypothetical protein